MLKVAQVTTINLDLSSLATKVHELKKAAFHKDVAEVWATLHKEVF